MKTKLSESQQVDAIKRDLLIDAECAEKQAESGPFYTGITRETLLAYAAECRAKAQTRLSPAGFIAGR